VEELRIEESAHRTDGSLDTMNVRQLRIMMPSMNEEEIDPTTLSQVDEAMTSQSKNSPRVSLFQAQKDSLGNR
jgi:hypothetical protein